MSIRIKTILHKKEVCEVLPVLTVLKVVPNN